METDYDARRKTIIRSYVLRRVSNRGVVSVTAEPYTEIILTERGSKIAYRYFGKGVWKVNAGSGTWYAVNAAYIPADVLKVAAATLERI